MIKIAIKKDVQVLIQTAKPQFWPLTQQKANAICFLQVIHELLVRTIQDYVKL